jgi:hypothetical protein
VQIYAKGGFWKECLGLCFETQKTNSEIKIYGSILLSELREQARYIDAAQVQLDFNSDYEGAVCDLLKGFAWADALLLIRKKNLAEKMLSTFDTALTSRNLSQLNNLFRWSSNRG